MSKYLSRYIPFMFPDSLEHLDNSEAIAKSDIYEDLKAVLVQLFPEKIEKFTRKYIKAKMLTVLYSFPKRYSVQKYPLRVVFEQRFPAVIQLFDDIKEFKTGEFTNRDLYGKKVAGKDSVNREVNAIDKGYSRLATLLQKIESKLVLDTACRSLFEAFPDVPLITIHDSILTTREYVEAAENALKVTLWEHIGFEPKFEIK